MFELDNLCQAILELKHGSLLLFLSFLVSFRLPLWIIDEAENPDAGSMLNRIVDMVTQFHVAKDRQLVAAQSLSRQQPHKSPATAFTVLPSRFHPLLQSLPFTLLR